MPFISRNLPFQ